MNTKDIAIILILLLAVLGLIIGAYYTESVNDSANTTNNGKIDYNNSSNVITIDIEPQLKNESSIANS
ncbi:MAG: hypothetical protein E7Z77_03745 [Methanobrevibacter sp.]|uniref:hypothetical protein n=1 Tax=Methanobrevibacter sp. TaxID=66852 RepID=UPI0025FC7476|nr:hypothetical protein [Methanobrevibacter sp.]MBE6508509.1 hypothetical protein [Methanobrevibacter sp.]